MAVVETERHGQILVVRMNRPERLNALNHEIRSALADTWADFRDARSRGRRSSPAPAAASAPGRT